MEPFPYRAVLFDLDGTLIDSVPVWRSVLANVVRAGVTGASGVTLPGAFLDELVGSSALSAAQRVREYAGWPEQAADEVLRRTLAGVAEVYRRRVPVQPGALPLLRQLRSAGVPTALVTSSDADLVDLVVAGLGGIGFDTIVCAGDVRRPKPAPEPYLVAAARLGVPADHCLAVEDAEVGVASALAAGCSVVAVAAPATLVGAATGSTASGAGRLLILDTLDNVTPARLAAALAAGTYSGLE